MSKQMNKFLKFAGKFIKTNKPPKLVKHFHQISAKRVSRKIILITRPHNPVSGSELSTWYCHSCEAGKQEDMHR